MTTPIYDPQKIFIALPVRTELDCFFCYDKIDPITDKEYIATNIPDKLILHFHPYCFDQMAWSMFHFYFKYNSEEKKVEIIH